MSNLERFGKLARRAYYQAIDGWAHDREWDSLSESERLAWETVGAVIRNAPAVDTSLDERILEGFRKGQPLRVEPQGAPCDAVQRMGEHDWLGGTCRRCGEPQGALNYVRTNPITGNVVSRGEPQGAPPHADWCKCGECRRMRAQEIGLPQGAPKPGATTLMFDGSEVMGTPVKGAPLHCHGCTDDMCPGCCDCAD